MRDKDFQQQGHEPVDGAVSGESDQLCSAAALQAGERPSGPPINKLTLRPSCFHLSSCTASFGVSQRSPEYPK